MNTLKTEQQVSDELKDMLDELRRRHWTLIIWGDKQSPELVAAMFQRASSADVLILRNRDDATAYRVPMRGEDSVFNPETVVYQYHSSAWWTLRAILALPVPGETGAPAWCEAPVAKCMIPGDLPKPVVIRPLGATV